MNKKQLKRLAELISKKVEDRSQEESTELSKLLDLASKHNIDLKSLVYNDEEEEALSAEAVKKLVQDSVLEGVKSLGLDKDTMATLQKSLADRKELTGEDIKSVVLEVLGGKDLDSEAIKKHIEDTIGANKGLTKEDVEGVVGKLFEQHSKGESQHQFALFGNYSDAPITHRGGNLSVAHKQLYNLMAMAAPKGIIDDVPTSMNDGIPDSMLKTAMSRGTKAVSAIRESRGKALTTTGSGSGLELIPSDLSSQLQLRLYLESAFAAEMAASEIQMPTDSFTLPLRTTRTTFYKGSENPGSNPATSEPGTSKVVFNAEKLIGTSVYTYEADEDAIIAMLPFVIDNLVTGAADALEDACINGDTTATHQDSDTELVALHAARLFKGLRKYANAGSCTRSLATGGITATNFLSLKKDMGKWGVRPRDMLCLTGVKGYNDFLGLDETLTAEKVGNSLARILTGEAPSLYGVRILVSSFVREDLNASGVYDGSTTTKGSLLLLHRPSWLMGVRRGFTVEIDRDIRQQLNIVVASFRRDLKPLETPAATTMPLVAMGYNYTS